MIIPVKCFTCGNVLGDKYRWYKDRVSKMKIDQNIEPNKVIYLTKNYNKKAPEGIVMDELNLNKMCCRRHMLTHVDIP
jgi:DNA-directed RNA polymerase subunit N